MAISMFFGTPIIEGNYCQFDFPVSSIEMEVKITIYLEEGGELLFDNYKPDKRFCRFLYGYWKGVINIESDSEEGYRFSNDQHSRRLFAERMRKGYSSIMISAPTCLVSLFTWKDGAILASDTRSTRRYGNGEVKYLDDFRKIHRLNDHLYFAITGTDSFYNGEDCFVFAEYILDQGPRSADGFCRAVGNLIFNSLTGFPANSIFLLYEFQKSMVSLHEYSVKGPSMDYKVRALHYDDKMQYSLFGEDYARQFVTDSPPSFYNVEDAIQKTVNLFDRVKEISALYPIPTVGGGTDIIYYDRYSDKIKKIRRDSKPL